eukprot:1414502-Prymnesium_polylepis.1
MQISRGRLPTRRVHEPLKIYVRGEPMVVRAEEDNRIQSFLSSGAAIEACQWEPMMQRQQMILQTLAIIADEYTTEHLRDTTAYLTSAPSWLPPGSRPTTQAQLEQVWRDEVEFAFQLARTRQLARDRDDDHELSGSEEDDSESTLLDGAGLLKEEGTRLFGEK